MSTENRTYTRMLRGKWYIAERGANGVIGEYFWIGNLETGVLNVSEDKITMDETFSRQMGEYKSTTVKTAIDIELFSYEFIPEALEIAMRADMQEVASSTGNNETSPATLAVGKVWALEKQKISNLVIVDSASTPLSLAEGVDYTLNAQYGSIVLISSQNLTMPLRATYDAGAVQKLVFNSAQQKEYAHRFEAENVSEAGESVLYEIFRSDLNVGEAFNAIDTEYGKQSIKGKALIDTTKNAIWQQVIIND